MFNLSVTIESGQIFRFAQKDGWYYVCSRDKLFRVNDTGYEGVNEDFFNHYFSLDIDYGAIIEDLYRHKELRPALEKYKGMRMIRQDPWECLISFICSSASNIPKIQMNVNKMSEFFGKRMSIGGFNTFSFPACGAINDLALLKKAKCGYRAEYILEANKMVTEKFLLGLRELSYDEAKKQLMTIPGVGPKVADCVLLFSLGFTEAFPIDTWMHKIMTQFYGKMSMKQMQELAREKFGKNAGYAQQFLFHYARNDLQS